MDNILNMLLDLICQHFTENFFHIGLHIYIYVDCLIVDRLVSLVLQNEFGRIPSLFFIFWNNLKTTAISFSLSFAEFSMKQSASEISFDPIWLFCDCSALLFPNDLALERGQGTEMWMHGYVCTCAQEFIYSDLSDFLVCSFQNSL